MNLIKTSLNYNFSNDLQYIDLYFDLENFNEKIDYSLTKEGIFEEIRRVLESHKFDITIFHKYTNCGQIERIMDQDIITDVFNLQYRNEGVNYYGEYGESDPKLIDFESYKTIKHFYFNDEVDFNKHYDEYPIFRLNIKKEYLDNRKYCYKCINYVSYKISEIISKMIKYRINQTIIKKEKREKKELINFINNNLKIQSVDYLKDLIKYINNKI